MAGFECKFVEKPPQVVQFECPICLLVLREPYQATCCGKSFCKECIEQVKTTNQPCPTCNAIENFKLFHNLGLQQSLNDFEVYCNQRSNGCEWRGELRELDKHLNSDPPADKCLEGCPFTVISCPLSHAGCDVRLPRRDVKDHVNDDLVGHLLKQTASVLTLNSKVRSMNSQLQSTSAELQTVKGEKQYLEQQVREQEEEIKQLKEAQRVVSSTGQPIGPVEITMTNFQQHQDDVVWFSPPFYTHPHGYKVCLCVYPKGFGAGSGTHLGVYIRLLCGEFDDQLKWPFRCDIAFQLVDQEGDKDHINNVVPFSDHIPELVTNRVTGEERTFFGQGPPKLLPLSDLQPRYLKNDCIKLRITKVVLPQ